MVEGDIESNDLWCWIVDGGFWWNTGSVPAVLVIADEENSEASSEESYHRTRIQIFTIIKEMFSFSNS